MATNPLITKYPLDKSGTSPTNRVIGEIRDINGPQERAFVPVAGPFYTASMKITNVATGQRLVPVDDYVLVQPFQQASLRTGLDVQCVVWLKTATPSQVSLDYQVVGGEYSWNIQAVIRMLENIGVDDRPISWGAIVGKPTAYPPAPHIHDIGDSYGWEYVVFQLEGIRNAILVGDEASHDELRRQIQAIRDDLETENGGIDGRVSAHIANLSNPHQTTKEHVGLGAVEDFPVASAAEALAGTAANRYMTPQRTTTLIARLLGDALDAHVADKGNPHGVTKAQVGLGNVLNYAVGTPAEALAGVVNDKYMTPQLTKAAVMALVGDGLNAHITNLNNPHQTTAAQVGLGLVDNFATATQADAQAGTAGNKYMTPVRVKEAITAAVGNTLTAHIADKNNPHQTTKTHVGLGLVENFQLASNAEAQAAASTVRYMTPALTRLSIMAVVGDALNIHAANMNNPHQTTKTQVGLGLVENFQLASNAEAQAATSTVRYMTPALTRLSIMAVVGDTFNTHTANVNNPHGVTKAQVGLSNIPNAITRGRGVNSDAQLLTAGAMVDHVGSGDHDARYNPKNIVSVDGSIHVAGGRGYMAIGGAWRQVYPAQWQ